MSSMAAGGIGPSYPQPNADWTEACTRLPAFSACFAMFTMRGSASDGVNAGVLQAVRPAGRNAMQNMSTPQASPRSRPFSFNTNAERRTLPGLFAPKVPEERICLGHLWHLLRVDERTH